jgi:hypothetical protein
MQGIRKLSPYRIAITRTTLLYYLVFLVWRGFSHLLPAHLLHPAITKMHYDVSFWLFRLSGLSNILVQDEVGATIFTAAVIVLCILSVVFPLKRMFVIPFTATYFLLAIAFNIYLCHSAHYLGGMVWLSLAFWARTDENFDLLWEGMRYYSCWVYASAFAWKMLNGAFFQWDAGMLTFKENLAGYLYQNPATSMAGIYYYFLQHPVLVNIGHKFVFFAEGTFIAGFFTKKYDALLILCALLIFTSIYFFSDVFFAELLIIIIPLLPLPAWKWLVDRLPALNESWLAPGKRALPL